mgnify:FL=1
MRLNTLLIERIRKKNRWTKKDLAIKLGMTRQNLYIIYRKGNVDLIKLNRIANVLGVSEDSLLLGDDYDAGST